VIARLLRVIAKAAEAASAGAFAVMFVLFLVGIFARYVLARPLAWTDELIMAIFLWLVFLTEALVIEDREQVTFDAVYDLMAERGRRIIQMAGAITIACLFIAALPTVLDYVRFLWRERTNVMLWRLDIVYFCFVIYWCSVIVRAAARLVRLAGPNWRAEVAPARADERTSILG
jgi:TRAP-type C4-dicarboxylate transport system permease small subunit